MATKSKKIEEKIIKLSEMTVGELVGRTKEITEKIQKKKLDISIGREKNVRTVFNLRKELAKVKTMINIKKSSKIGKI